MKDNQTFSSAIVKHIDYFTEEYVKQLCDGIGSGKLDSCRPFVGAIQYPGSLFPSVDNNYPVTQFQDSTYIGLMDFVFPEDVSVLDDLPALTLLEVNIDGVDRKFVTVAGGDILAGAQTFSDYVASLYPTANDAVPFNHNAIHLLRNIRISGGKFNVVDGAFVGTGFISGSHTLNFGFCFTVAGYVAIIQ